MHDGAGAARLSSEVARMRAISRAAGLLVDARFWRRCSSSPSGNMNAPPSTGWPPIAASLPPAMPLSGYRFLANSFPRPVLSPEKPFKDQEVYLLGYEGVLTSTVHCCGVPHQRSEALMSRHQFQETPAWHADILSAWSWLSILVRPFIRIQPCREFVHVAPAHRNVLVFAKQ